jgi:hypothetical protein
MFTITFTITAATIGAAVVAGLLYLAKRVFRALFRGKEQ